MCQTPGLRQLLTQTLWPYIGPVLFVVVQACSPARFAVDHPPAGGNLGERRPRALRFLIINQNDEAATVIVERIEVHLITYQRVENSARPCAGRNGRRSSRPETRPPKYGPKIVAALTFCWKALDMPTGKRLAPMLGELVAVLRPHGELDIDDDPAPLLVGMSPDRRGTVRRCR